MAEEDHDADDCGSAFETSFFFSHDNVSQPTDAHALSAVYDSTLRVHALLVFGRAFLGFELLKKTIQKPTFLRITRCVLVRVLEK